MIHPLGDDDGEHLDDDDGGGDNDFCNLDLIILFSWVLWFLSVSAFGVFHLICYECMNVCFSVMLFCPSLSRKFIWGFTE